MYKSAPDGDPDAVVPAYAKAGDAAVDLVAVEKQLDEYYNLVYNTGLAATPGVSQTELKHFL